MFYVPLSDFFTVYLGNSELQKVLKNKTTVIPIIFTGIIQGAIFSFAV